MLDALLITHYLVLAIVIHVGGMKLRSKKGQKRTRHENLGDDKKRALVGPVLSILVIVFAVLVCTDKSGPND